MAFIHIHEILGIMEMVVVTFASETVISCCLLMNQIFASHVLFHVFVQLVN